MHLHSPALEHLDSYTDALRRGRSPDNLRPEAAVEELRRVEADPEAYVRQEIDRAVQGPSSVMPDGRHVTRLPILTLWMWGGAVGLRRHPTEMPPPEPTLSVLATPLNAPAEGRVVEPSGVAEPPRPIESAATPFLVLPVRDPAAQRWLVTVVTTAGNNWRAW